MRRRIVLLLVGAFAVAPPAATAGTVVEEPVPGTWRDVTPLGWGGGPLFLAADRSVPGLVYATVAGDVPCEPSARSEDAGATWTAIPGACELVPDGRRARRVYGKGARGWLVSDDAGRTWRPLARLRADGRRAPGRLVSLVPVGGGRGLAGVVEVLLRPVSGDVVGQVWRTGDGVHWRRVGRITDPGQVVADPATPGTLLVTVDGDETAGRVIAIDRRDRLVRRGAIPADSCGLIVDPRRPRRLYCGTAQSDDSGRRWRRLRYPVIGVDPIADRVYGAPPPLSSAFAPIFDLPVLADLASRRSAGRGWAPDMRGLLPDTSITSVARVGGALLASGPGAVYRRVGAGPWAFVDGPKRVTVTAAARAGDALIAGAVGIGVLRTADGGASWQRLGGSPWPDLVAAAGILGLPDVIVAGIEVGIGARVVSTTDGGRTWRRTRRADGPFAFAPGSRARLISSGLGWIGPGDYATFLLESRTSGRTWRRLAPSEATRAIAVADDGRIWTTITDNDADPGDSRLAVLDPGDHALRPAFPEVGGPDASGSAVPVAGEPGGAFAAAAAFEGPWDGVAIYRTRDAGGTWARVLALPEWSALPPLVDLAPGLVTCAPRPDSTEAPYRLLLTTDGGATWRPVPTDASCRGATPVGLGGGRLGLITGGRLLVFDAGPGALVPAGPLAGRDARHALR